MTKKPRPKEGVRHQQYQPTTEVQQPRLIEVTGLFALAVLGVVVLVGKSDATIHHPKRNYSGNGKDEQFV